MTIVDAVSMDVLDPRQPIFDYQQPRIMVTDDEVASMISKSGLKLATITRC